MGKRAWMLAAGVAAVVTWNGMGLRLQAAPAAQPAAGAGTVEVYSGSMVADEMASKGPKELTPITMVGTRNGTFSCKIVVESRQAIKGVKASVGQFTGKAGSIPAADVEVRYAKYWDGVRGVDMLLDSSPEVEPNRGRAFVTVWVTVSVPKDAPPGTYTSTATVQPDGAAASQVQLTLEVADWTLPDTQDYRTWSDFVESPDTLALEYKDPLWSEENWKRIGESFKLLSVTGCRDIYIPLVAGTNFGNEQSMVRWIKKPDGTYDYDYSVMDRYLDTAIKNLGTPKLIIMPVWDLYMSANSLKTGLRGGASDTRTARTELMGKGPRVTVLDPATKETSMVYLPRYEDSASKALWEPMFAGVLKHLRERGLEKTVMLGTMADLWPDKQEVAFWKDISGGLPWVIHAHGGPLTKIGIGKKALYGIADVGYAACVNDADYGMNPAKGHNYGWNNPTLLAIYQRYELIADPPAFIREFQVFNLTANLRGAGRMGGDLWPVIRSKRGDRVALVYARYPENNWRNLDIHDWILAPGPDGPVATARLEYFREGVEVCEARIFLESALLNPAQKAQIGDDLAKRCQDALDAHQRAMWNTIWGDDEELAGLGSAVRGRNPWEGLYQALTKTGTKNADGTVTLPDGKVMATDYWHGAGAVLRMDEQKKGLVEFAVGWQDREKALFDLAAEVAAKLRAK